MYKLTQTPSILRLSDGAMIPADAANRDYADFLAWQAGGNTPEPCRQLTAAERIADNIAAVQSELDRQAHLRGYDSIVSACSYAGGDPDDPFQAEGKAFLKWRSAVWSQAYAILAEVEAGSRPLPTPDEAVAAMPALVLP
jgi:hypothetical protein